jgi:hypothetical protein
MSADATSADVRLRLAEDMRREQHRDNIAILNSRH